MGVTGGAMKIYAISDMHGQLDGLDPAAVDLVVVAGDFATMIFLIIRCDAGQDPDGADFAALAYVSARHRDL